MMNNKIISHFRNFLAYKEQNFKFDLVASIVVFLVAIPLCLGIAIASGAPLLSGIISGIIGGLVVGSLSPSQVSVSGPAAGMATLVLATIAELGSFPAFLVALIIAGGLQMIIGACRAGFIAEYVPSNVVQGLLCAIGILLIVKQLPLAFTLSSDFAELKTHLLETSEEITISPLVRLIDHLNAGAIVLTALSFAILIYFDKTRHSRLKDIPAAILVVIAGVVLNELFILLHSPFAQSSPQLVSIPKSQGFTGLVQQLNYHDSSAWYNPKVYYCGFILAIVASLETLLNITAAEKLDKKHRSYSKDRELLAQGVGNLTAGLLGGLPVTSVIVRTSVNIQAGSKTKLSTILHGLFILLTVMLIPSSLNKIPLCSLAALLIYTGYKLTNPKIYRKIYQQGADRFIPFVVTVIVIVLFDLLTGILAGLLISLFYILKSNSEARIDLIKEYYPTGIVNRLVLPQQISFLNRASLVAELESIPKDSKLIIDARYSTYIDKEILELIKQFQEEKAPLKLIALNLIGFKDSYDIHHNMDFIDVTTVQSALSPAQVLNILREGNYRFVHDTRIHRAAKLDIELPNKDQHPIAVVLGCIDSRVPVETIFDMTFGDLFIARVAGNVVNDDILASIEYACGNEGAKLIVVLGHTHCGAIAAACDGIEKGHITQLLAKIKPAIQAEKIIISDRSSQNLSFVKKVTELNVGNTLQKIYDKSAIIRHMIEENQIGLVGALYDVSTGQVHFRDFSAVLAQLGGDDRNQKTLGASLKKIFADDKKDVASQVR